MEDIIFYLLKHCSSPLIASRFLCFLSQLHPCSNISYGRPIFLQSRYCPCISQASDCKKLWKFHAPTHSLSHRGKNHTRWALISATGAFLFTQPAWLWTSNPACLSSCHYLPALFTAQRKKGKLFLLLLDVDIVMVFFFSRKT